MSLPAAVPVQGASKGQSGDASVQGAVETDGNPHASYNGDPDTIAPDNVALAGPMMW